MIQGDPETAGTIIPLNQSIKKGRVKKEYSKFSGLVGESQKSIYQAIQCHTGFGQLI